MPPSCIERAGRAAPGCRGAVAFGAVVRREEHERAVRELLLVERLHELAEGEVHLRHVRVVLALHVVGEVGIKRLELRVGLDGVVWLVGPHGEEERLRLVALLLQPRHGFAHDERRGVAFEPADRLAVADEVARVLVRRAGVVLRGHPPVVTVVAGLRLRGVVEEAVQVPLAAVARRVARALEQLG
jgi:hypothetical protein